MASGSVEADLAATAWPSLGDSMVLNRAAMRGSSLCCRRTALSAYASFQESGRYNVESIFVSAIGKIVASQIFFTKSGAPALDR